MGFDVPIWRVLDLVFKVLQLKAVYTSLEAGSEQIRKAVCSFQLEYTNYHFGASRAHRAFKAKFLACPEESHKEFRILQDYLDTGFKKLCGDQVQAIREYFRLTHRHRDLPRVGIHGITDEHEIVDIVVAPSARMNRIAPGPRFAGNYSALSEALTTGLPYVANNIPTTLKKNAEYRNEDIDVERARLDYKSRFVDSKLIARLSNNLRRRGSSDVHWNGKTKAPLVDGEHLYKSQVVVPITYRTHADLGRLDSNLIEILGLLDEGRSVLGCIMVDHPATYYFDDGPANTYENIDINILYLFADMLSLIFIVQFMYTTGSESVNRYTERFNENGAVF